MAARIGSIKATFAFGRQPLESTPIAYWLSVWTMIFFTAAGVASTARKIAVSSATLFVAVPRYSKPSCTEPPPTTTTPRPAGPGFPEQAPSVYAIHSCSDRGASRGAAAGSLGFATRFAAAFLATGAAPSAPGGGATTGTQASS